MQIRQIQTADAGKLLRLQREVEAEAAYMLFEAGERKVTVQQVERRLEDISNSTNSAIFMAESVEGPTGFLVAMGGSARRNRHSASVVIGIKKEFRGQGIGTALFQKLDDWALEKGLHRLELTVVSQNEAGLALYKKAGFEIEGTKRNSLNIDGDFVDEFSMAKLL